MPKTLPPTLVTSLVAAGGGTPTRTPTQMSPVTHAAGPPPIPPQPIGMHHQQQVGAVHVPPGRPAMPPQAAAQILHQQAAHISAGPPPIPPQPAMMGHAMPPAIPPQPTIMQQQPVAPLIGGIPGYAIPGNFVAQQPLIPGELKFLLSNFLIYMNLNVSSANFKCVNLAK